MVSYVKVNLGGEHGMTWHDMSPLWFSISNQSKKNRTNKIGLFWRKMGFLENISFVYFVIFHIK